MRIVVLAKMLRTSPDGAPVAGGAIGGCDLAALSAALAIRARVRGSTVTVVAAERSEHEGDLATGLAAPGVDRIVRVFDPCMAEVDYHGVALVLAAATRHVGFDLVLCGDRSEDESQGAVGPAVAEALQVPHVTGAIDIAADEGAVLPTRRDPGMLRTLRAPLPALVAVTRFAEREPARAASGAAPPTVDTMDLAGLGLMPAELRYRDCCRGRAEPVRHGRSGVVVASVSALLARLKEDRVLAGP